MHSIKKMFVNLCLAAAICGVSAAHAQDPVKIGVILPLSGPFADYGKQIGSGIKLYMKQHGDTVAGRKIEVMIKDDTGVAPEVSKRLAQEMLMRDKVDMLAGFGLTPAALAVAPLATQAQRPMIIMNASTSIITTKSPYVVRFSHTIQQVTGPIANWAAKNGVKQVYILVADYAPGIDSEAAFRKTFEGTGNKIVGNVRVPVNNLDFSAYMQKIKDLKPDAVFLFLPPGEATISFMKTYKERGLDKAGIRLLGTHDLTDENLIHALGEGVMGIVTSGHYSTAHDSALNKKFVKEYTDMFGTREHVNFMSVAGYDGMAGIYAALKKTGGNTDGNKLMDAFKSLRFESPRGPISIDPETRDIVQTVYLREVKKVGTEFTNVEFDKVDNVKDPGK